MVGTTTGSEQMTEPLVARPSHRLPIRITHWLNVPLLGLMLWSGLRIYNANAVHALDLAGLRIEFFPQVVFDVLDADHRLARGISLHLTVGWLFLGNGLAYLVALVATRHWRRIVPDRRSLAELPSVLAHELRLRAAPSSGTGYNAAQRLAYTGVIGLGVMMVATGFAIYKPVQLRLLVTLLGGYETARLLHFTSSLLLVGFVVVHLVQVARAGRHQAAAMVTGYLLQPAGGTGDGPEPADGRTTGSDGDEVDGPDGGDRMSDTERASASSAEQCSDPADRTTEAIR